jgi:hypothetical protein
MRLTNSGNRIKKDQPAPNPSGTVIEARNSWKKRHRGQEESESEIHRGGE